MVKRTGPTNPELKKLIESLRKKFVETKRPIWKSLAEKLEKPRRQKIVVNLWKINKYVNDDEIAVIPGKVLSEGELTKKIKIAAWKFSKKALEKIEKYNCQALDLYKLMEENPKKIRIIC